MRRRFATGLGGLLLAMSGAIVVGGPAESVPVQQVRADDQPKAGVWARPFSPNGDGVRDSTKIRLSLPRWADNVQVRIGRRDSPQQAFRVVDLGRLRKGKHTWTWDGRRDDGTKVGDGAFRVEVVSSPRRWRESTGAVVVDRAFSPGIAPSIQFSLPPGQVPRVFPRTTVVTDHVTLVDTGIRRYSGDPATGLKGLRLEIRDKAGRVVLRQQMSRRSDEEPCLQLTTGRPASTASRCTRDATAPWSTGWTVPATMGPANPCGCGSRGLVGVARADGATRWSRLPRSSGRASSTAALAAATSPRRPATLPPATCSPAVSAIGPTPAASPSTAPCTPAGPPGCRFPTPCPAAGSTALASPSGAHPPTLRGQT